MSMSLKLVHVLRVLACTPLLLAGPVFADVCDRNPEHKNCSGNGGNGGGIAHPVDITFRDRGPLSEAGSDRIRSDVGGTGSVTYTDGEPGVSTRIRDDGLLLINIDSTDRAVVLDFGDLAVPANCGATCEKNFTVVSTDDYPPAAAGTIQVFDNGTSQHRTDQFFGMSVGETLNGEMKLAFGDPQKNTRFSVRFQAVDGTLNTEVTTQTSFLEITRSSQNSWFIAAVSPADLALLISKVKNRGKVTDADEGTYHMPFGLTVTCQSTCPDRTVE